MSARTRHILAVLVFVSVASFATGRLFPRAPGASPDRPRMDDRSVAPLSQPLAPVEVPALVPNVVGMTSYERYSLFKAASAETLRSYHHQLMQIRPRPTRWAALESFFKTLIQIDPILTQNLIIAMEGDDKWTALSAIREGAPPRGMSAVAEVLVSLNRSKISGCSWDLLGDSLDEWGKNDPLALKQFLESHRDKDVERYFPRLVRRWAAYDPEAARQWIEEQIRNRPIPPEIEAGQSEAMENSEWRGIGSGMFSAWVEGLLDFDAVAAVDYVFQHSKEEHVTEALSSFTGNLFANSPERARNLVSQLSGEAQRLALRGVGVRADRFVEYHGPDNQLSPRFVVEWMFQLPQAQWENNLENPLREWRVADADELFAWISELPADKRVAVVREFPVYFSGGTPGDFEFILQLRDPVVREQLLEKLMRTTDYDGAALRAAVEQSSLPETQKSHLIGLIPAESTVAATVGAPTE